MTAQNINPAQRWTRVTFLDPWPDPTRQNCLQSDPRPDPARLHANAMRYITDYIFTIEKQHCAKYW